jgi:hypothetical protein
VGVGDEEAATDPALGEAVVAELRRYFAEGRPLMEPATLLDAWVESDDDGVAVLRAVYEHAYWPERTGLRRRLDRPPTLAHAGATSAERLACDIAYLEISEPLGRMHDLLTPDDQGVHWWGDGYRQLSEHPDFEGDQAAWLQRHLIREPSDETRQE